MVKGSGAHHSIDADRVNPKKISKDNKKVMDFAHVAYVMGISYGQLQQMETIAKISGRGDEFNKWLQRNINN